MSKTASTIDPLLLPYRACVGIMLINAGGLIWIGRRHHSIVEDGENWQMPQGGIDGAEAPELAAFRELAEETGTDKAEIIGEARDWLHLTAPTPARQRAERQYRGQKPRWSLRFGGAIRFQYRHPRTTSRQSSMPGAGTGDELLG